MINGDPSISADWLIVSKPSTLRAKMGTLFHWSWPSPASNQVRASLGHKDAQIKIKDCKTNKIVLFAQQ